MKEMKNIFLFTGKEKFLLDQDLHRRRDGFVEKFGSDTVFRFDPEHFDVGKIMQSLFGGGLFVTKKMIIIYGVPTDTDPDNKLSASLIESFTKEFLPKMEHVPADVLLAFVSYTPDKRSKMYKHLAEHATAKEYKSLKDLGLKKFIRETLAGCVITDDVIQYLLMRVGNDMYRLYYECDKLQHRCQITGNKNVQHHDIDSVVFGMVDSNVFAVFDVLLTKPYQAIKHIESIREEGMDRNQFMGTMYRGVKTFLILLDCVGRGMTDGKQIAQVTKLHPFVVSKYLAQKDLLQKKAGAIRGLFRDLLQLDAYIKTGKWSDALFWLRIKTLIAHFIS